MKIIGLQQNSQSTFLLLKLRRDDVRLRRDDDAIPLIVNFFDEKSIMKKNQALRTEVPANQEDLMRRLKQEAEISKAELDEKKRMWEKSNAMLEKVLTDIKTTLLDLQRREALQANSFLSAQQIHQLKMIAAKNEREERRKRQLNIIVLGMQIFDEDLMQKASEFLEKHFHLRNCVSSARTLGRNREILVIQLTDMTVKTQILKNLGILKDMDIRIRPDLTDEQRFVHRKLRGIGWEAMNMGKEVRIGYAWVEIDHVKYYWCGFTHSLRPASTRYYKYWNS